MYKIDRLIEFYGGQLKSQNKLSYTWLMFDLMDVLNDEELNELDVDLVEVADKVMTYVECYKDNK